MEWSGVAWRGVAWRDLQQSQMDFYCFPCRASNIAPQSLHIVAAKTPPLSIHIGTATTSIVFPRSHFGLQGIQLVRNLMEHPFYQACRQSALKISRQTAKQSTSTLSVKRPRLEESAHVSAAPPLKRSRRSFLTAGTTDLGKRAHEYKLSRNGPNGEVCGTWLRDFCDETWGDVEDGKLRKANRKRVARAHFKFVKNLKIGGKGFASDVKRSLRVAAPCRRFADAKSRRFGTPVPRYLARVM